MTGAAAGTPAQRDAAALAFAALTLLCCVFAFVGLGASSFWIDELFTLFLVDHDGGVGEVVRRALTDTSPPAYYILLHGWLKLFGLTEVTVRLLSALLAVGAVAVFYAGTAGTFSRPARLFATALATTSVFWFEQSQNGRTYSLCLLVSAGLLALALRLRRLERQADGRFPAASWAGMTLLGIVGSLSHFYVFLEVGLIYFCLLLTLRRPAWRAAIVLSGLLALGPTLLYVHTLLGATKQNLQNLWFKNDPGFFLGELWRACKSVLGIFSAVAVAGLVANAVRGGSSEAATSDSGAGSATGPARWTVRMAAFVLLGVVGLGIAVSLTLAPSFSARNVLVCVPLLWALLAGLYDAGRPAASGRVGTALTALLVLLVAIHGVALRTRLLPRNEDWRASAELVASFPQCAGQDIPVVLPYVFGPSTPYFRDLAERWFFGRYYPDRMRLHAYVPDELAGRVPGVDVGGLIAARARDPAACPVLAWGVHDLDAERAAAIARDMERLPGMDGARVEMRQFDFFRPQRLGIKRKPGAFVFLAARPETES
jgi:uncharacterized membrane protein